MGDKERSGNEKSEPENLIVNDNEEQRGADDPTNPLNWPTWRKVTVVGIVSAIGFSTPFAADISAPSIPLMMESFNSDNETLAGFIISIYVLGNAVGPVLFAPASEVWGRSVVFHITNVVFLAFTVGCALATSLPSMLVFRFFAGCAGAAPLAVGAGTIADLIPREQRGRYFAVFATGGQLAPLVGPVIGGFLTARIHWRWTFWIVVIIHGIITVVAFLFLRETYAPYIRKRRARLSKDNGNIQMASVPKKDIFLQAFVRPLKVLFGSPMVLFLAIYQAMVWGYRFLMYTTIPQVFGKHYHFGPSTTGLAYLGNGIGATIAMYSITKISDSLVIRYKDRHKCDPKPEIRLLPLLFGGPLLPVGLFWYGWSAQLEVHWIVPILGTFFFGAGIVAASLPSNLYVVDAFTQYAASAMAGSMLLRAVAGGLIPMAGNPMFAAMGVGWGCSLLGFISVLTCVLSIGFVLFGERLREKFPLTL
ncbi:MFS general substrate transporter [Zopfia rhizophila CBS 207.26]|uniref:MFS general substrate transporter n=1 Tax=Zopfia rhizophila CBS 207.26 TaxID=1314779 RepID=A0A6A6E5Q8_9PEZI|nr:MFS general substrate transporter [Zopfia rhizophila CBS 207.26]